MSFVDDYSLTRSSVFKTLVGLFVLVTVINVIVIRQVYKDSDAFHRAQLIRQLQDESSEFSYAANQSKEDVERLLAVKQTSDTNFYYRLSERTSPLLTTSYPVVSLMSETANISIGDTHRLVIGIDRQAVEEYRKTLIPIVFSGIVLPIAVMLIAALFFTVLILKRLERVNQAMNRVLCGEKSVKIPVSKQDDEFDILAIHLNFMIEQMAKNEESLKSLTVGMAHDMRTPMARLKLRLEEVLSDSTLTDEHQEQFSACHDELELILSLFNSMLEITKLNSGQTLIATERVDLGKIAQDAIEFISPIAEMKQQSLVCRLDQECEILGDKSLLFRAVFNLVENAVKYTPEKGKIEVVVDYFGVTVADNGIGISDKDKMNVCRPMFRADKSRTEFGNGLGLSLVDAVVKRHHAHLILRDNTPGLRARLYFER
ncbi:sensor histidine kinase [Vibrio sp. 10N.222.54.F12]|uniref:sensor histidine kinase n=1 Tax=Vibrio TaxID=662 RepID=UPI000C837782|nr:HAMP domain-containing sensor histidine kinase [Vibrio tasmaniensis]PML19445.1 two-component sensor histidine kinase [Vibrio tasmaniensis]PML46276.1 two-component sensor histidine kinase [Vibrio tasmaniensis]